MRIKSLNIAGFKSFAEPGHLEFGAGITGIVGPNGCGKSNIIDAIRWCMGEMSAKHLRGRAMQDVIFAGSDSRGPSGMAEVTLTFHNDGDVPPMYASYTEISVTRRLHRDGNSEYLINKIPCRLRDITDLFLGTGVGTRAYSIIEQGRISYIVSSRPEDRRTLIEEVAGITKFKARKKSAERRMEATEQNLARVTDIVTELERQLATLRRQAKKAEKYRATKDELRDLDLHVASARYLELVLLEKVQRAEQETLSVRLQDGTLAVETKEAKIESERLLQIQQEEAVQRDQKASAELESKLAALERDLSHWRRQAEELVQRQDDLSREIFEATAAIDNAEQETERLQQQLLELAENEGDNVDQVEIASEGVEELQLALQMADEQLSRLRQDGLEMVHEMAQQRTLLATVDRQKQSVEDRSERAQGERLETSERAAEEAGRIEALSSRKQSFAEELQEWRLRHEETAGQLKRLQDAFGTSEQQVLDLKGRLAEQSSRLNSLRGIARKLEGYSDGVRALMSVDAEGGAPKPIVEGVLGLLAEQFSTDPSLEVALESALGESLQFVWVEDQAAAVRGIAHLKSVESGRGGFVPLSAQAVSDPGPVPELTGVVGPIIEQVEVRDLQLQSVADALLGDVLLVDDLDTALAVWSAGTRWRSVTRGGEVVTANGVVQGGADDGSGVLAKHREIRQLEVEVAELDTELRRARTAHEILEASRLQTEVDLQQLDKDIRTAELEALETNKDLEAATKELARLKERDEVLALELEQRQDELAQIETDRTQAQQALTIAEGKHAQLQGQVEEIEETRSIRAEDLEARTESLTALKIQVASRAEKRFAAQAALERLQQSGGEHQRRIERAQSGLQEAESLQEELVERIQQGDAEAKEVSTEAEARRSRLSETRASFEALRLSLSGVEREIREGRRANELVQESLVELKMDLQRLNMEREKLIESVAERHDVELRERISEYHLKPVPGIEMLKRRTELERSLKNMGSVNLSAIDECREVEERYDFLQLQRDDLTAALDSLKRAIQRINRASRERFREAFESVNEVFQKMFPRLFRGGEARLELLPHDDILEAGVDIIAQPPGKKLQNVGLLSGGEKALTATALVFSIFLIKPSPFCVLDEVDAPLDDSNVGRFNEMLREMSSISQFIMITHNKLTMSEADKLYGITMQEPGMSKLVSVDFSEFEDGDDEQAA